MEVPFPSCDTASVPEDPFDRIVGTSRAAEAIRQFGRRAAAVDASVLILGESGTGKGMLARAIHDASPRARAPYVQVNCAAIPEALFESEFFGHVRGAFTGAQYAHKGLFEQANGGTLFLDEIGELPLPVQAKLLTILEDRVVRRVGGERLLPFDTRIISATAADLEPAIGSRAFRRDLYHRLRVLHFTIPPLRARYGDVALLADIFVRTFDERYGRRHQLSDAAYAALTAHSWPGNIRELAHTIESAVVAAENGFIDRITVEHVVSTADMSDQRPYAFRGSREEEMRLIQAALSRCAGNKTRAAAELGMSRNTLINKLRATAKRD